MTAATQLLVTTLLAVRIYTAARLIWQLSNGSNLDPLSKKRESVYPGVMWMLVESGAAISAVEIIFLAVWRNGSLSGLSQLTLAVLGQLCATIPLLIVARVGLRLAFDSTGQTSVLQISASSPSGSGSSLPTVRFAQAPGNASKSDDEATLNLSEMKGGVWSPGSEGEFGTASV
ncbi:hypothetical protein B0H10DRAFT_521982 [Mycena sp. CBHHK59/15]|nr:hypothetical protein B0H10DRAFT_521982 [Mycena sp. CBHHK59/15]